MLRIHFPTLFLASESDRRPEHCLNPLVAKPNPAPLGRLRIPSRFRCSASGWITIGVGVRPAREREAAEACVGRQQLQRRARCNVSELFGQRHGLARQHVGEVQDVFGLHAGWAAVRSDRSGHLERLQSGVGPDRRDAGLDLRCGVHGQVEPGQGRVGVQELANHIEVSLAEVEAA
eukprot:858083-Rhodomonas_salina.1